MWVKICANTNVADALSAADAGADAVGFVFAPSKRQVTSEQVLEITRRLPAKIESVGVFATDDPFEVEHYVACSGLTVAQLHGTFDADQVQQLSGEFGGELKIIQTVAYALDAPDGPLRDKEFVATLREVFAEPAVWAVLVDASKLGVSGGLGVAFDWSHVGGLVRQAMARHNQRVILAGGLRPENVADAIARFQPWGVDVASGVETSPGKKDAARIANFVKISGADTLKP